MQTPESPVQIPLGMKPFFQEYDVAQLDIVRDGNLIIQRTLEYGTWEEIRWLFATYGSQRIRLFLRQYGQRGLQPSTFHYWRKLLRIRKWRNSPFASVGREVWNP